MTKKLFTLLLAVAAGVGTMFAWDYEYVQIGDFYYNLDATNQTAEVTYQESGSSENYKYLTTANIPASVTYNEVTYSVTSIGEMAFQHCESLTSVTIPNSVTSIGVAAFSYCSGLPIINNIRYADTYLVEAVDKTLSSYTIKEGTRFIGDRAFDSCTSLTSVTIPNSVTSIGYGAFAYCSGLTSVTIPNSVTSIGEHAFESCSSLTSIEIPNSVTNIGSYAFNACSFLTSVTILSENFETEGAIFISCPNLTHMSGPAKMLYMTDYYLSIYTISRRLKNVIITGGEMTENEFLALHEAYKSLESVDMSAASNTTLSDEAFKGCYNLKTLKLPAGLTKIGYMVTAECVNLESITIPASVEEIGDRAFEDCRSLKSITFGGSANPAPGRFNAPAAASQLKRIGNWAFYNAHELQNLVIPEGVTEIGDGAFYGCTYLEEMVLPSSVQSIGDNCFALCAKLTKIVVNSTTPPEIEAKTFYDVKRQIPVYVPDEAVSAYEADTYWQEFDIQGASKMPQDIDQVPSDQVPSTKLLRDGKMYIIRGEKVYTIDGRKVR